MFLYNTFSIPKWPTLLVTVLVAATLFSSETAVAQQARRGVSRRPAQSGQTTNPSAQKPKKKRAVRSNSKSEIGLGYTLWNERFAVTKNGVTENGYAGFGGFVATLERNWTRYRWQYGANFSFGVGKASADGVTTLPEGRDRPWYTASFSPFFHYRFNMNFMAGMGALVRYRAVDWTSLDPNTKIEESSRFQATGVINLRWSLDRWTLIQSFAPLDFKGDTLWTWTAQYVL